MSALGLAAGLVSTAKAGRAGGGDIKGAATYTDPSGDAGSAPDIGALMITGDPATGTLSVSVTAARYVTTPLASGEAKRDVTVYVDADRNDQTGSSSGSEYLLWAWTDSTGRWWNMNRWNGSRWEYVPQSPTSTFSRTGDLLTWTLNVSDIGGSTTFDFHVVAAGYNSADEVLGRDDAPDTGRWIYDVAAPTSTTTTTSPTPTTPDVPNKVTLLIDTPKTAPARAVAGKRFTVTFPVHFQKEEQGTSISISTGQTKPVTVISWSPVPTGRMVCDPSVAGKVIAHSESFKNSQARLSFVIPKTARAKLLRVSVKITATEKDTAKTVSATKIAGFRVR